MRCHQRCKCGLQVGHLSAAPRRWECMRATATLSTAWLIATKKVIVECVLRWKWLGELVAVITDQPLMALVGVW